MGKYRILRVLHLFVLFISILSFAAFALYTYETVEFVDIAENIFEELFGRRAVLADNFVLLWPILIGVVLFMLIIEEPIYAKLYKKQFKNRKSMKRSKRSKQTIVIVENPTINIKEEKKAAKEAAKAEKAAEKEAVKLEKEEKKAVKAEAKAAKAAKKAPTPAEPAKTEEVIKNDASMSSSAKLNALLKNYNK